MQLDPARAVDEVEERRLALAAARGRRPATRRRVRRSPRRARGPRSGALTVGDRRDARVGVRERVDPVLAQRARACAGGRRGARLRPRRACSSRSGDVDLGDLELALAAWAAVTLTASPFLRPSSALPTGDSLESRLLAGSASVEPTIVYVDDLPESSSLTWTSEPTRTTSLSSSEASITEAERSLSSSVAMRASSIACSFLASSYSEFSEMSPNSRASLMRSATSRRLSVERYSISSLSFSRPSGVRRTSFCIARPWRVVSVEEKRPRDSAGRAGRSMVAPAPPPSGSSAYAVAPFPAAWIARHTRSGWAGMSRCVTPRCASASTTAFCAAGVEPIVPASPIPLAPSGLRSVGVCVRSVSYEGRSAALGIM